jgi:hypothetical protein
MAHLVGNNNKCEHLYKLQELDVELFIACFKNHKVHSSHVNQVYTYDSNSKLTEDFGK